MSQRFLQSFVTVLFAALAIAGCGESHTSGDDAGTDAGGIVFDLDGAMFDGGVDAPIAPVTVGEVCTADGDCVGDGAVCIEDPDLLPGGYCSQVCDPAGGDPMCPTGSTCVNLGGGQAFCFRDCDPAATARECRAGYGCSTSPMLPAVCIAGCFDASDCGTGLDCDPSGGGLGAGACFDPSAMPGDPCLGDADCGSGATCITEEFNGWVGGYCVVPDCDVATNAGCDAGACFPGGAGPGGAPLGLCGSDCTTAADCRTGYACEAVTGGDGRMACQSSCTADAQCTVTGFVCNEGTGTCSAPFNPSRLGQTCSRFGGAMACTGGTCISERVSGYPGSYCAYAGCETPGTVCDVEVGGVCASDPVGSGTNYCFAACTTDTDCRAGYACRPSNPADDTSPGACWPACTDSSVCSAMAMRTCNAATGLCE